ncbi:MAG: hypothetical protein KU37_04150 [Sulfuricurvum sp. PC08-66]|nr:MAG: hypothetical protein KU37_04150 [Sulfuricurvum sp. PC08-66]
MQFITQLAEYIHDGGWVMWPLLFSIFVLWYALGFRYHRLRRGSNKSVRDLIRKSKKGECKAPKGVIDSAVLLGMDIVKNAQPELARKMLDDAFGEYEIALKKYKVLVRTIVVIAPLVGLLGTVIGMIETFDSMATMNLFSQSGGIAGGISQALFTTQFGLVVAVPGVVLGRLLDRQELRLTNELTQIKDLALAFKDNR